MKRKLKWIRLERTRLPKKHFGPLLTADINEGGRRRSDFNMASEHARMSVEGDRSGCVKYGSSGLALPCHESEKKPRN